MMKFTLIFAIVVAASTVLYGIKAVKSKKIGNVKLAMITSLSIFSMAVIAFGVLGFVNPVLAAEVAEEGVKTGISIGDGCKYLAAALSTGLATIGTGMAVGSVGSSAIGAVSEDATILGKTLIFVGMAEGIAIYGMIISILILFV